MASLPGSATLPPTRCAGGLPRRPRPATTVPTSGRGRARPGCHVAAALSRSPGVSSPATTSGADNGTVSWVEATAHFFREDARPIMLFDGVCNLCNGGVRFVRDADRNGRIRYEALQNDSGRMLLRRSGRAPDDISSVVLVEKDRSYIKSEAVLKIMEYLDLPFPQLAIFLRIVPLFLRDVAYDGVANNRYVIFGRSESCEL